MKRPWQIWTLYVVCLAAVLPAMAWLTTKALELDRADAAAQQQAELEERIASALWRIDTDLTRILAPEIARPHFVYSSFYPAPDSAGGTQQVVSPLLARPSEFVKLYFQIGPNDDVSSPQFPVGAQCDLAVQQGASPDLIAQCGTRLKEFQGAVKHDALLACLPKQTLPQIDWNAPPAENGYAQLAASNPKVVNNTADVEAVKRELDNLQSQAQQQPAYAQQQAFPPNVSYNSQRAQSVQRRGGNELINRDANLKAAAQQQFLEQRLNLIAADSLQSANEGVSEPVWIDSRLVLARRVEDNDQTIVQGCWLDWPHIEQHAKSLVADTLPSVEFVSYSSKAEVDAVPVNRLLATLPVRLVVPPPASTINPYSPIRISLVLAWSFLAVAATAVGLLLQGVITLSERRGAFVSAVTHELRTPLTTFRMYTEMLAEDMTPLEQRQSYLQTLRVEADRLSHLVENVLQYARLERGSAGCRREQITADVLLHRSANRLADRAEQASMEMVVEADDADRQSQLSTDPVAVEQILFNLVDNACKYAAQAKDRRIHLSLICAGRKLRIAVSDHGPGIPPAEAGKLFRPFSKSAEQAANSAAGVGLGLALCRRLARDLGGSLHLEPLDDGGASFVLTLPLAG